MSYSARDTGRKCRPGKSGRLLLNGQPWHRGIRGLNTSEMEIDAYPTSTSNRCYLEVSGPVDYQDNMALGPPMAFSMLGTLRGFSAAQSVIFSIGLARLSRTRQQAHLNSLKAKISALVFGNMSSTTTTQHWDRVFE